MMGPEPMIRTEWIDEVFGHIENKIAQSYATDAILPG